MKRRNAECGKFRRPLKRNKITEGIYGSTLLYFKFLLLWALVLLADFILEFRFEYLWPFWLLLRSVYDSFKYQGLAFSVFFVCIALTSDMICFLFVPVHWLFFAASTYVWVQYVWHTEKGICMPTVILWLLFVYIEVAVRLRDLRHLPFHLDLCRPFAAHCIGYPVVTLGFGFKSYVSYRMRLRQQREVARENAFYIQLLQEALPAEDPPLQPLAASTSSSTSPLSPSSSTPSSSLSNVSATATSPERSRGNTSRSSASVNNHEEETQATVSSSSAATASSADGLHHHHHHNHHHHNHNHHHNSSHNNINNSSSSSTCSNSSNGSGHHRDGSNHLPNGGPLSAAASSGSNSLPNRAHRRSERGAEKEKEKEKEKENSEREREREKPARCTHLNGSVHADIEYLEKKGVSSEAPEESERRSGGNSKSSCRWGGNSSGSGGREKEKEKEKEKEVSSGSGPREKRGGGGRNAKEAANNTSQRDEYCQRLEGDIRRLKSEVSSLRQSESDQRSQLASAASSEKSLRAELSQTRSELESLQSRMGGLQASRQAERQVLAQAERRLAEERRARAGLEAQLAQERRQRKEEAVQAAAQAAQAAAAQAAAVRAAAQAAANKNECSENCRMRRREMEVENKQLCVEFQRTEERLLMVEREAQVLRQYKENQNDTEVLLSALSAMQDKTSHLENSLSAETRLKLDLFSALGEAKRQLEIRESLLMAKEREVEELKGKIAEVLAVMPSSSHHELLYSPKLLLGDPQVAAAAAAAAAAAVAASLPHSPPVNVGVVGSRSSPASPPPPSSGQVGGGPGVENGNGGGSALDPNATAYTPKTQGMMASPEA